MTKTKTIARQLQYRSSHDPSILYTTILWSDGTASCNCPGWCKRKPTPDGARSCKHVISAGFAPISESVAEPYAVTKSKQNMKHGQSAPIQKMKVVRKFKFEDD